jgi:hypothetical protein
LGLLGFAPHIFAIVANKTIAQISLLYLYQKKKIFIY